MTATGNSGLDRRSAGTVVCAGPVPAFARQRLARHGPVVTVPSADEDALLDEMPRAVALVAKAATPVTARVIGAAPGLRVIGRTGVGTDQVDLAAATRRGIPVVITPSAGGDAVAEGCLAMLLALGKRLAPLTASVRDQRWADRDSADLLDLTESLTGVVGLGRIGTRLAELITGLGGRVLAHDPFVSSATLPGIDLVSLPELFSRCQFISLHVPLTSQTRGLIDASLLAACQPGTVLVNAARGGLISSLDDLWAALQAGSLGGVGLDVFECEPPAISHPLFADPRVILTPHVLALSRRGRQQIFEDMCTGVEAVLTETRPPAVANPQVYMSS